jgi:hypothetical protein
MDIMDKVDIMDGSSPSVHNKNHTSTDSTFGFFESDCYFLRSEAPVCSYPSP